MPLGRPALGPPCSLAHVVPKPDDTIPEVLNVAQPCADHVVGRRQFRRDKDKAR